jgi:hypothetical protein
MLRASAGRNPAGALRVDGQTKPPKRHRHHVDINIEHDWHRCQLPGLILVSIGTSQPASLGTFGVAGEDVAEDWAAVAQAISNRMAELRVTQMDVAAKARISLTTLRELQHNINPRRRRPQTLAALSEALDWPPGYLAETLRGGDAQPYADESHDPVLESLSSIERELGDLRQRVEQIERQLSGEGG